MLREPKGAKSEIWMNFQQLRMTGRDSGASILGRRPRGKIQSAGYQSLAFRKIKFNKALIFY
jgi:hypothetical protein